MNFVARVGCIGLPSCDGCGADMDINECAATMVLLIIEGEIFSFCGVDCYERHMMGIGSDTGPLAEAVPPSQRGKLEEYLRNTNLVERLGVRKPEDR